jgi:prepilin-type N-terminal cleavage/methylation domain-containing protein/prepilin-type processing-associated H-X9-DG protein
MIYIHKLESGLSSIFLARRSFSLSLPSLANIMGFQARRSMPRSSHFTRAFTLIELLVVIAIIAILISIAYPVYTGILERGKATKDMNNLRQIGIATQAYMNDNDGVLPGSATVSWMSQLYPKYLASWYALISPFDNVVGPRVVSDNNANSAISYGINGTAGVIGIPADRISKPTVFIVFAPAQAAGATVRFPGIANTTSPANLAASANITVIGNGNNTATTMPGGNVATGGTHSSRRQINALFADWHVESMSWSGTGAAFTNTAMTATDPDGASRWTP